MTGIAERKIRVIEAVEAYARVLQSNASPALRAKVREAFLAELDDALRGDPAPSFANLSQPKP